MKNQKDEKLIMTKIQELMGFLVIESLGRGCSGRVYKCKRESYGIQHISAIKAVLMPKNIDQVGEFSETYREGLIRRSLMEVEAVIRIGASPNILSLEDYKCENLEDGRILLLIRMELAKPFSIPESLGLSRMEKLELILELGRGLIECEKSGIVHGDIKPENIFIGKDGKMKLGDFGIAGFLSGEEKLGGEESQGTLKYCTPEFWRRGVKDKSGDLYSLGLIAFSLFNDGYLPFMKQGAEWYEKSKVEAEAQTEEMAFKKRINGEYIPQAVHSGEQLSAILGRTIGYLPENRYESSMDFCRELEELILSEKEELVPEKRDLGEKIYSASEEKREDKEGRTKVKKCSTVNEEYGTETESWDWVGNLWNGDFACYHEGKYLISDLVNGGLYITEKCRMLKLLNRGYYFSLKSYQKKLYGINVDGHLVEIIIQEEDQAEIALIRRANPFNESFLKYLLCTERGLAGINLSGEVSLLVESEFYNTYNDDLQFGKAIKYREKTPEIEDLLAFEKKCFRPIPYKSVMFHGGVQESGGLFIIEKRSGTGYRISQGELRTLNMAKDWLLTVDLEGCVSFSHLKGLSEKSLSKIDGNVEATMGKKRVEATLTGCDIEYICCLQERIFMQSAAGKMFLYEKGASVELCKLC